MEKSHAKPINKCINESGKKAKKDIRDKILIQ